MRKVISLAVVLSFFPLFLFSCATEQDTRRLSGFSIGTVVGGAAGALLDKKHPGQGAAIGAIIGGLSGLTIAELSQKATVEADRTGKEVTYENEQGKVTATPAGYDKAGKCKRIMNRTFKDGKIIAETMDMICDDTPRKTSL